MRTNKLIYLREKRSSSTLKYKFYGTCALANYKESNFLLKQFFFVNNKRSCSNQVKLETHHFTID